jgi:hypothetical protein
MESAFLIRTITVSHLNDRDTKLVELDAALNAIAATNLLLRAIVRLILRKP